MSSVINTKIQVKCQQNLGHYWTLLIASQSSGSILHGFSVHRLLGIRVRQPHHRLV